MTMTVAAALRINGAPASPALAAGVTAIRVAQALGAPAMIVVTFADLPAEAAAGLGIGMPLAVMVPGGETLIEAELTALEQRLEPDRSRSLTIRGYDKLHRLRKHQQIRILTDCDPADLIRSAASSIGVDTDIPAAGLARRAALVQHEQSDFALIADLALANGRYIHLQGGTLRLISLGGDGQEAVRLIAGETLLDAAIELNAEGMRRSTMARGWDPATNQPVESIVSSAAQDALEMRMDALAAFDGLGERMLLNRLCDASADTAGIAQADIDRATARSAILIARAEGDPALRPGRAVQIEGVGGAVDGSFVISEAIHRFDATAGYVTEIGSAPPALSTDARAAVATIARVTSTDDADGRARVKARLVAFGDIELWLPVLSLGGGDDKGFALLPEPGDDVLVLLPNGDPAFGIVLGGLYGARTPPGERPRSGARNFALRTPAGQSLTLDGVESRLRLETGAGDVLEMTPDGTRISVTRDLLIEAPGRALKIRAARIDFEKA